MLSNNDIDHLLAIGEQQCAELLAQGRDRTPADKGPEGDGEGVLAEVTAGASTEPG
jgi:hypothetical protein